MLRRAVGGASRGGDCKAAGGGGGEGVKEERVRETVSGSVQMAWEILSRALSAGTCSALASCTHTVQVGENTYVYIYAAHRHTHAHTHANMCVCVCYVFIIKRKQGESKKPVSTLSRELATSLSNGRFVTLIRVL